MHRTTEGLGGDIVQSASYKFEGSNPRGPALSSKPTLDDRSKSFVAERLARHYADYECEDACHSQ